MRVRPNGPNVLVNPRRPEPTGFCDRSGEMFNKRDLVKQFEWRGNSLVWTGFLVAKKYLDIPQEQLRPPLLDSPPDPQPVPLARPEQTQPVTHLQNYDVAIKDIDFVTTGEALTNYNGIQAPNNNVRRDILSNFYWGQ